MGSLTAGLVLSRRATPDPAVFLPRLLLAMAGASAVLVWLGHGVIPLTLGLIIQGAAVAPTLGAIEPVALPPTATDGPGSALQYPVIAESLRTDYGFAPPVELEPPPSTTAATAAPSTTPPGVPATDG